MRDDATQDASEVMAAFAEVYRGLGLIASMYARVERRLACCSRS